MLQPATTRHQPAGRRAFVKGMAAAVVAVSAGALPFSAAFAITRGRQLAVQRSLPSLLPFPIPAVGIEIPCSMVAANVPLQLNSGNVTLNFSGGITYKVASVSTNAVGLEVVSFQVTALSAGLGTVTMEQSDFSTTPLSLLQLAISSFPPHTELLTYLLPTLTVSNPPGGSGPLTAPALELMTLRSSSVVATFPPVNQPVELLEPVPFGTVGATIATLEAFTATVNTILA